MRVLLRAWTWISKLFLRAGTTVCQKKGLLINTFYFHFPIALDTFLHAIYIAFSFSSSFCIHLNSEIPGNEIIQIHILWSSILISIARIQNKLQGKGQKKKAIQNLQRLNQKQVLKLLNGEFLKYRMFGQYMGRSKRSKKRCKSVTPSFHW